MKNKLFIIAALAFTVSTSSSCGSSELKVEKAEKNLDKAQKDLEQANQDYVNDIENYRKITADRIEENNKSIADFNARKDEDKKKIKADYQIQMKELEDRNNDLKKSMDDYKANGKEGWELFKKQFSSDMDDLGASIKSFFVSEKK